MMQKRHFVLKNQTLFTYKNSEQTVDAFSGLIFLPGLFIKYLGYCRMTNKYALEIRGLSSSDSKLSKKLYHRSEKTVLCWTRKLQEAAGQLDFSAHYSLGKQIAQSKHSTVHECQNLTTGKIEAVKIIDKASMNKMQMQHLSQEIQVVKVLSHPQIVQFKQVFESETQVHIVMELVRGAELS